MISSRSRFLLVTVFFLHFFRQLFLLSDVFFSMTTIYSFFEKKEVESEGKGGKKVKKAYGKCIPCSEEGKEKLISREKSSTSGMRSHLRIFHKDHYTKLDDVRAERDAMGRKIAKLDNDEKFPGRILFQFRPTHQPELQRC